MMARSDPQKTTNYYDEFKNNDDDKYDSRKIR